ncbi:hypothetical protein [Streptomyces sp. NPDC057381]|uniref:hypothetical protein n=1 Tax=unclassified Streptomyces TaxID=2593676 RepID=UPI00362F92F6
MVFGDAFHLPAQLAHLAWPSGPDVGAACGFAFHFGDQAFGRVTEGHHWRPVAARALLPTPLTAPSSRT